MHTSRALLLPLSLSMSTLAAAGCTADVEPAETAIRASELAELAFAPLLAFDAQQLHNGQLAWIASHCDSEPQLSTTDMCGHERLSSASFAWSECAVEAPVDAPFDELLTSGTIELHSEFAGDCGAPDLTMTRTLEFAFERETDDAVAMIEGQASLTRIASDFGVAELEFALSRTLSFDGQLGPQADISGVLSVSIDAESGTRTASGVLNMTMQHPYRGERNGEIELIALVRGAYEDCRWPIGGSIVSDGHMVDFSSSCGQASLDGEPVNLAELELDRRPGRRGHRPSGK